MENGPRRAFLSMVSERYFPVRRRSKWSELEAEQSPVFSSKFKNVRGNNSISPYVFMNLRLNIYHILYRNQTRNLVKICSPSDMEGANRGTYGGTLTSPYVSSYFVRQAVAATAASKQFRQAVHIVSSQHQ
jgi:hypothetical protein